MSKIIAVEAVDSIDNIEGRTSFVACSCCNKWSIMVDNIGPLDRWDTCIVVVGNIDSMR